MNKNFKYKVIYFFVIIVISCNNTKTTYNEDGTIKMEEFYINDSTSKFIEYNKGRKVSEYFKINGKLDSIYIFYYPDKTCMSMYKIEYNHYGMINYYGYNLAGGKLVKNYKNGKLNGKQYSIDSTGFIYKIENYSNHELDGECLYFNKQQKNLTMKLFYINGDLKHREIIDYYNGDYIVKETWQGVKITNAKFKKIKHFKPYKISTFLQYPSIEGLSIDGQLLYSKNDSIIKASQGYYKFNSKKDTILKGEDYNAKIDVYIKAPIDSVEVRLKNVSLKNKNDTSIYFYSNKFTSFNFEIDNPKVGINRITGQINVYNGNVCNIWYFYKDFYVALE